MSNEDHKIQKDARKWAPDLPEGRAAFYEAASINSALLPPAERMALIEYIDGEMANEGNLRQSQPTLRIEEKIDRGRRQAETGWPIMAVATLSGTIAKVQQAQLRETQIKNELEMASRLVVPNAEPLTKPEQDLLAVWVTWCSQRGVRHLPASPAVIATFVQEIAHRGEDFILSVLGAIRRMHVAHLNLGDPTQSRAVLFSLEQIIKTDLAPRSWPAIEKTLWATLPAETRKIIARREAERENDFRRSQNDLAAEKKRLADGADKKTIDQKEIDDMSKKKNHEVLGKYTDNKPGITRVKTPGDTPGRDISKTLDQNQSGGSGALTKPPSWNKK